MKVDDEVHRRLEYGQTDRAIGYLRLFLVFYDGMALLLAALAVVQGDWFIAPIPCAMAAIGFVWCHRLAQLRIVAEGNTLTVVNVLRTHHLERDDISAFRIQPIGLTTRRRGLSVKLRDFNSIECHVMNASPVWFPWRDDLDVCQSELREWLHDRDEASQATH